MDTVVKCNGRCLSRPGENVRTRICQHCAPVSARCRRQHTRNQGRRAHEEKVTAAGALRIGTTLLNEPTQGIGKPRNEAEHEAAVKVRPQKHDQRELPNRAVARRA